MGKLLGKVIALVGYLCIATLVAQVAGVVYLRVTGKLTNENFPRPK